MANSPIVEEIDFTPNQASGNRQLLARPPRTSASMFCLSPIPHKLVELNLRDLQYRELKAGVQLKLTDNPVAPGAAAAASLFVVSNTYGYFVAGSSDGFIFDTLSALRSAFESGDGGDDETQFTAKIKVNIPEDALRIIRLSADELTVVVALTGGKIQLYSVMNLLSNPNGAKPDSTFSLGSEIRDIRPNPAIDRNGLAAVLLEDGVIKLMDMNGTTSISLDKKKYTAIAWSSKGKQIMCGTDTGILQQIDPEGVVKKEHAANPANSGHHETAVFIVVYCPPPENGEPVFEFNVCVISKEVPGQAKYMNFGDMCFPMPNDDAGPTYYMTSPLKSWGKNVKDLIMVSSSPSPDVGIIGRGTDGNWEKWDLDDTMRPALPGSDTICVGNALDLTSTAKLEPIEEDGPEVQPVPILYIYNNLGVLAAYHILNLQAVKDGLAFPAMVSAQPLPQSSSKPKASPNNISAAPSTKPSFGLTSASKPSPFVSAPSPIAATNLKAPAPATPTASPITQGKLSPAAQKPSFGAPTPTFSVAPNPVVNPNPAFQQVKPTVTKQPLQQQQPRVMQKILQEQEAPIKISHKKSEAEESSAPAPKVSAAMDALSRQLENTYLAMTEELKTLHSHVRETEELVKAREHVFVELDQFMQVTAKRIKAAKDTRALAETVYNDFVQLRADIIKVSTKRDEVGRLLKAREDPSLRDMVHSSELNPAQLNQQARMKSSFENVDNRLRELEAYVETLSLKASRLRNGNDVEGPTLDTIRRAIWNISHTLLQRQDDLNRLSSALDNLAISDSLNPTMDRVKKGSVKEQAAASLRRSIRPSESFSAVIDQRSTTHAKDEIAHQLRRVFTQDRRSKPILSTLTQSSPGGPLSVLPRVETTQFIPASEPRRADTKKRLSTVIPSQSEVPIAAPTPIAAVTPAASFVKSLPGSSAPSPFGSASSPALNTSSQPSPAFGSTVLPSFGSATSTPFGSTPNLAPKTLSSPSPLALGLPPMASAKAPSFAGFQVPKQDIPSSSSSTLSTPAWSFPKAATESPKGFTGFQVPTSLAQSASKPTPAAPAPAFSFAKPAQKEPEQEVSDTGADSRDEQYEQGEEEEEEDVEQEEEEYDGEEDQDYPHGRRVYVHDGQEYEIEDGSEPETWGSDTDQRDFDNGEEYDGEEQEEDDNDEYGPDGEEENEEDEKNQELSKIDNKTVVAESEKAKEPPAKSAWAAPGFQFPAAAPPVSGSPSTAPSNSGFSFFTAKASKESGENAKPQLPFGTAPGVNTFGSQTAFTFGKPAGATPSPATFSAPKEGDSTKDQTQPSLFSKKPESPPKDSTEVPALKTSPVSVSQSPSDKSADEAESSKQADGQGKNQYPVNDGDGSDGDGSDGEQERGSIAKNEDKRRDSDGSDQEDGEPGDDSDKESALTAVQVSGTSALPTKFSEKARSSVSSVESFNVVEKTRDLEESDLNLSKADLGGTTTQKSTAPTFGSGPAFGSTLSANTPVKGLDMPFVKLPRAPRGTRDSLDSNTEDDDDDGNIVSDGDGSPLIKSRDTKLPAATGFGQVSDTKDSAGGLDSFNLSLGGSQTSQAESKPTISAWGTSSTSSWESVTQVSAPSSSGWGKSATLGSALPATSAPAAAAAAAAASPFATQASSALTPAPNSWGSSGAGFGKTSQPGTGATSSPFGQVSQTSTSTPAFGQTSSLGGFGQTSQLGTETTTGFGQTSTLGSGTGFGQTSTLGSGSG
ncbi:hypothetical protein BGX21_009531, partial [Mortierella sp. AD011]